MSLSAVKMPPLKWICTCSKKKLLYHNYSYQPEKSTAVAVLFSTKSAFGGINPPAMDEIPLRGEKDAADLISSEAVG